MLALLDFPVYGGFTAETRASLIRARRKLDNPDPETGNTTDPLPLMPADRYQYGFRWKSAGKAPTIVRLMGSTVLQQTRIPSEGLLKQPPPTFTTFNFDVSHTFHTDRMKNGKSLRREWELGLTIQNLTNVRYREMDDDFLDGMVVGAFPSIEYPAAWLPGLIEGEDLTITPAGQTTQTFRVRTVPRRGLDGTVSKAFLKKVS